MAALLSASDCQHMFLLSIHSSRRRRGSPRLYEYRTNRSANIFQCSIQKIWLLWLRGLTSEKSHSSGATEMNSTIKTILSWVLILVAAVGLYSFVEQSSSPAAMLTLTDFLNKVEAGQVAEVEINGSNLRGKYTAGGSNEQFRSTIPPEYPRIYDTLVARGVIVKIIPPETNPWSALLVSWGLPLLFVFGSQCLLTWCIYRAILSHLRRTPNGSAT
jgi:hypothetical protein